jgi:hypothetical protein
MELSIDRRCRRERMTCREATALFVAPQARPPSPRRIIPCRQEQAERQRAPPGEIKAELYSGLELDDFVYPDAKLVWTRRERRPSPQRQPVHTMQAVRIQMI